MLSAQKRVNTKFRLYVQYLEPQYALQQAIHLYAMTLYSNVLTEILNLGVSWQTKHI